jgi:hypothetical protein
VFEQSGKKAHLVEVVEAVLQRVGVNLADITIRRHDAAHVVVEHMPDQDGFREGRAVVLPRALLAVPACSDFEVEWAIHFVFLCAVDAREVLRAAHLFVKRREERARSFLKGI